MTQWQRSSGLHLHFLHRCPGTPPSISGCFPLTLPAGGLAAFWFRPSLDSRSSSIKSPHPHPQDWKGFLPDPVVPRCVLLCRGSSCYPRKRSWWRSDSWMVLFLLPPPSRRIHGEHRSAKRRSPLGVPVPGSSCRWGYPCHQLSSRDVTPEACCASTTSFRAGKWGFIILSLLWLLSAQIP